MFISFIVPWSLFDFDATTFIIVNKRLAWWMGRYLAMPITCRQLIVYLKGYSSFCMTSSACIGLGWKNMKSSQWRTWSSFVCYACWSTFMIFVGTVCLITMNNEANHSWEIFFPLFCVLLFCLILIVAVCINNILSFCIICFYQTMEKDLHFEEHWVMFNCSYKI